MKRENFFVWPEEKMVGNPFPYVVFKLIGVNVEKLARFASLYEAADYAESLEESLRKKNDS